MITKQYKFDEVVELFDKKRVPLSSLERQKRQGKYRYYGAQGVIDYVDDFLFDGEYVLVAEDGENLKSLKQNIAQLVSGKFWVNNHAHIIQTREMCRLKYFYYYVNNMNISEFVTGSAQPKLSQASMKKMVFELPDIAVQDKILKVVSAIDEKISKNDEINDNLLQQAQALYQSWFVDFDQNNGRMPDSWEDRKIGELTSLVTRGIAPKYDDSCDQVVLNQKCIRNHTIDVSLGRQHKPKAVNEKWLQFGDLLINSTGEGTLGRTAQVWFEPQKMTVDSHITIVRPLHPNLIYLIGMWGLTHEREIEALHTGSTGQTELPRDRVKEMPLLLPDTDTLERFNAIMKVNTGMINANQKENDSLAQLRDGLLPRLLSGEMDISDLEF